MSHESQPSSSEERMRATVQLLGAHVLQTLFAQSDQRLEQHPNEKVAWQFGEDNGDAETDLAEVPVVVIDKEVIGILGFEGIADRVYKREEFTPVVEQIVAASEAVEPQQ